MCDLRDTCVPVCFLEQAPLTRVEGFLLTKQKGSAQPTSGEKSAAPAHICLSDFSKVNDSNCDPELLSLLLDAKLLVKCVSTPFYPRLVQHLLAGPQQGRWDAEELARHLRGAGHEAEAGSLLLAARGTHRALRTFSTALGAGQHWV